MAFNYKSPIQLVFEEMQLNLNRDIEQALVTATQEINVVVDKEELTKILIADETRYREAYVQGYRDALDEVEKRIHKFMRIIANKTLPEGMLYEYDEEDDYDRERNQ